MVKCTNFLDEKNRLTILQKIYSLKSHWNKRNIAFYTLGTALYLDTQPNFANYQNQAKKTNPFLQEHFASLYDLLKKTLEKELNEEVLYEDSLALPGFHIFMGPQNEEERLFINKTSPAVHYDLQFHQAKWNYQNIEKNYTTSFTITIKLPSCGSGLNYWDITYAEYPNHSNKDPETAFPEEKRHYLPYEEGKIVIHNGLMLHQIAIPKDLKKDDVRITMQGHAIRCDGVWRIHW